MKKVFTIIASVIITAALWAQSPAKMSYQAVIRNSTNSLVTNTQIGMEINIRQATPTGTIVYTETLTPTTNANGLVSIEIGNSAGFNTINWANGPYFIETKTAVVPPLTTYTITGTSQILSVPYALHANTADSITGNINETDPVYGASVASGITAADTTNWNNKLDNYSETDPAFTNSPAFNITTTDITNLSNLSGINTGDQDLTSLASKNALADSIAQLRNEIPDLDSFISSETDPIYNNSVAAHISASDTANWNSKLNTESDPLFNAWDKDYNDLINTPALWDSTYSTIKNKPDLSIYATKNMNNENITNLANPVNNQDAVTKSYVTLRVSATADTLFLGNEQWVLISGISANNSNDTSVVVDIEGNRYNTISIGSQIWFTENLKTTKFNDGVEIPYVDDPVAWSNLTTPAYCYYRNLTVHSKTYGMLYNFHTVASDKLCPIGWHVPTDADWTILKDYIPTAGAGGAGAEGVFLKSSYGWFYYGNGYNEFGFNGLPNGLRNNVGMYQSLGQSAYWWSSTPDVDKAYIRHIDHNSNTFYRVSEWKKNGNAVRCLKN